LVWSTRILVVGRGGWVGRCGRTGGRCRVGPAGARHRRGSSSTRIKWRLVLRWWCGGLVVCVLTHSRCFFALLCSFSFLFPPWLWLVICVVSGVLSVFVLCSSALCVAHLQATEVEPILEQVELPPLPDQPPTPWTDLSEKQLRSALVGACKRYVELTERVSVMYCACWRSKPLLAFV